MEKTEEKAVVEEQKTEHKLTDPLQEQGKRRDHHGSSHGGGIDRLRKVMQEG